MFFFSIIIIKSIMTYGYIRVSSDKQTVENQRFEIIVLLLSVIT